MELKVGGFYIHSSGKIVFITYCKYDKVVGMVEGRDCPGPLTPYFILDLKELSLKTDWRKTYMPNSTKLGSYIPVVAAAREEYDAATFHEKLCAL